MWKCHILNMKQAFDRVWHNILIHKLSKWNTKRHTNLCQRRSFQVKRHTYHHRSPSRGSLISDPLQALYLSHTKQHIKRQFPYLRRRHSHNFIFQQPKPSSRLSSTSIKLDDRMDQWKSKGNQPWEITCHPLHQEEDSTHTPLPHR